MELFVMEAKAEIWAIYDENRVNTGRTIVRGCQFAKGEFHVVVHVCILNSKGEMLIQQRQPFKQGWSNLWDVSCGGSAVFGDTSKEAAQRELFEEIGLAYDFSDTRPCFTINFSFGFDDWYIVVQDVDLDKLTLQYEEVQGVKWASKAEILAMMDGGEFIPYKKPLIEMVFAMGGRYGGLRDD